MPRTWWARAVSRRLRGLLREHLAGTRAKIERARRKRHLATPKPSVKDQRPGSMECGASKQSQSTSIHVSANRKATFALECGRQVATGVLHLSLTSRNVGVLRFLPRLVATRAPHLLLLHSHTRCSEPGVRCRGIWPRVLLPPPNSSNLMSLPVNEPPP